MPVNDAARAHLDAIAADVAHMALLRALVALVLHTPDPAEHRRRLTRLEELVVADMASRPMFLATDAASAGLTAEYGTYVREAASQWLTTVLSSIQHG